MVSPFRFQLSLGLCFALSVSLVPGVTPYPRASSESCLAFCREASLKLEVPLSFHVSCGEGTKWNKCGTECKGHCEEDECEEYTTRKGTWYRLLCPEQSNAWWQKEKAKREAEQKAKEEQQAEEKRKEKERKEEEGRKRKEESEGNERAAYIFMGVAFVVVILVGTIAGIIHCCRVRAVVNADRRGGPRLLGQPGAVAPGQLPPNPTYPMLPPATQAEATPSPPGAQQP